MARHEGDFRFHVGKPLEIDEILSLLAGQQVGDERSREDAIACYLSASEGWDEAVKLLGGAFAEPAGRLRRRKED